MAYFFKDGIDAALEAQRRGDLEIADLLNERLELLRRQLVEQRAELAHNQLQRSIKSVLC